MMIHESSDVQTTNIGKDTNIWQYCVVLKDAEIGANCNICSHGLIENDVVIGDRVTVKSGVQLWDGVRLEDDVFVGPNVTFTNDKLPRSKRYPEVFLETIVKRGASLGANATILPGIIIGAGSMVGAGAVVTRNVPAGAVVVGNPAQISGYVDTDRVQGSDCYSETSSWELSVAGASIKRLQHIPDLRGNLCVAELGKQLTFEVKRLFFVYGVPNAKVRGEHAHKECHQFLICIKGSVNVIIDDSEKRQEVLLDEPNVGLHIEPGVWGVQYRYSHDAVLIVLASHPYSEDDYIRDYSSFLLYKRGLISNES